MAKVNLTKSGEILLKTAFELSKIGDRWVKLAMEHSEKIPSCDRCERAGCCYQTLTATPPEGMMVAAFLDYSGKNTPELREKLLEIGDAMESTRTVDWLHQARPCPFLVFDGGSKNCSVYEGRPLNCKTYFTITDPVYCCPRPLRRSGEPQSDKICSLDNREIMYRELMASEKIMSCIGADTDRPFIRTFPAMVAVMMEAILITDDDAFVEFITQNAAMDKERMVKLLKDREDFVEVQHV